MSTMLVARWRLFIDPFMRDTERLLVLIANFRRTGIVASISRISPVTFYKNTEKNLRILKYQMQLKRWGVLAVRKWCPSLHLIWSKLA